MVRAEFWEVPLTVESRQGFYYRPEVTSEASHVVEPELKELWWGWELGDHLPLKKHRLKNSFLLALNNSFWKTYSKRGYKRCYLKNYRRLYPATIYFVGCVVSKPNWQILIERDSVLCPGKIQFLCLTQHTPAIWNGYQKLSAQVSTLQYAK